MQIGNLVLTFDTPGTLFTLGLEDGYPYVCQITPPVFEINGVSRGDFVFHDIYRTELPRNVKGQRVILTYSTISEPKVGLDVHIRSFPNSPFLRLKFILDAKNFGHDPNVPVVLTKSAKSDNLIYFQVQAPDATLLEMTQHQLSHFDPVAHSYMPAAQSGILLNLPFVGPITHLELEYCSIQHNLLVAYEHGADHPNGFLQFELVQDQSPVLQLSARKGNYHDGQFISQGNVFSSVWFEIGLAEGTATEFLQRYRQFFLDEVAENIESRQPYIYYNTWNHQERRKYFDGLPYLTDMSFDRMNREIDIAHLIGIDVFVIDTGWYGKTGDWLVNLDRFPDGLHNLKAKLDGYGMKLGLWFNPIVAAQTSEIYTTHPEYVMEIGGKPNFWGPIWETEASYGLCLASPYADHFIETLVRLHIELGVSYFKWDAIGQYGCDSPHHLHGTADNSAQERSDCYAYESGRQMIRIVEEVSRRCPNVIVDFDITEGGRFVGLGFLSVGKYFLINNGPYFHDFDIPKTVKIEPDTINVFFYPGPARSRICRQGTKFDSLIPSILFLTHYLPDGPPNSQRNALASLVLGGNGIWGDLVSLLPEDIARLSNYLTDYKQVAHSVTRAYPRQIGFAGSSPEIHEKISPETATGFVAFFTVTPATITHITQPLQTQNLLSVKNADTWEILPSNCVKITVQLERNGAQIVYLFGQTFKAVASPTLQL